MRPGRELDGALLNSEEFFRDGHDKQLAAKSANDVINQAGTIAEAWSLVWGHTVIEVLLIEYCRIAAKLEPRVILERVKRKKVCVEELLNKTKECIFEDLVSGFLTQIERESLTKKAELLNSICKPHDSRIKKRSYVHDVRRLCTIDERRHDIVHGRREVKYLTAVDDDLEYLFQTAGFYIAVMHDRFGLVIIADPAKRELLRTSGFEF